MNAIPSIFSADTSILSVRNQIYNIRYIFIERKGKGYAL